MVWKKTNAQPEPLELEADVHRARHGRGGGARGRRSSGALSNNTARVLVEARQLCWRCRMAWPQDLGVGVDPWRTGVSL
jgi:hypothetical protein